MERLCTCLLFGVLVVNEVGVEDGGEIGALYLRKTIFFGILQI